MLKPTIPRTVFLEKWCILHNASCDQSLRRLDFRVLCRLHYHHNSKSGQCNPAVGTMAKALGATPRGGRGALRSLEAKGYILTFAGGGLHKSNQYRLCIVKPKDTPVNSSSGPSEPQAPKTQKGSSSKTEKETNKRKQSNGDGDKKDANANSKAKLPEKVTEKISARSIGRAQAKLAQYLGENGWEILQNVGEKSDEIYEKLVKRQIDYTDAAKLLTEMLAN